MPKILFSCPIAILSIPNIIYFVMLDSSLYALNMLYYHCLIKKLFCPVEGQNKARFNEASFIHYSENSLKSQFFLSF